MSKKQAIAFFKEISKNKQLVQEVKKVVDGKNSDEEKAKELISLAKKHNFTFTQEDAQNAQEELKKPLSTEEMFDVSGGKMNLKSSLMAMALLAGLGVGGATMSSMEASAMKRSNPSSSGKRGKTDQTLPGFDELISRLSNRAAQGQPTTNGNQQQITPQPAEATGADNLTQNGTPSSNGQATPQDTNQHSSEPPNEKKIRANVEHNK